MMTLAEHRRELLKNPQRLGKQDSTCCKALCSRYRASKGSSEGKLGSAEVATKGSFHKFWTSFYEQAAQIRIPTYDDYSSVNEQQSHSDHDTTQTGPPSSAPPHSEHTEPSMVSTESSFLPTQAAYASTPATSNRNQGQDNRNSETPSWTASLDSPLARLDREIQDFNRELQNAGSLSAETPALSDQPLIVPDENQSQPTTDKGKGRQPPEPLLRNVLRHGLHSTSDSFTPGRIGATSMSPLKVRGKVKTPVPKTLNPYLPPNVNPAEWSGIVNLADPHVTTPKRSKEKRPASRRNAPSDIAAEESFEGLPAGMSPPVMMSPARPPRSSAELLGQTPLKEAAQRIGQDLISDVQRKSGGKQPYRSVRNNGVESSMSTVPTPPSLSRYRHHDGRYIVDTSESTALDPSLESMMRRIGLRSDSGRYASEPITPVNDLVFNPAFQEQEEIDSDYDSFDDEENNSGRPSSAFLMATRARPDDSFGSSNRSSDSLSGDELIEGQLQVHPFARELVEDGFDDSMDDDFERNAPTETLFGVPREQQIRARVQPEGELRMLGEHLFEDTITAGSRNSRNVEESPTPAGWPASPLELGQ